MADTISWSGNNIVRRQETLYKTVVNGFINQSNLTSLLINKELGAMGATGDIKAMQGGAIKELFDSYVPVVPGGKVEGNGFSWIFNYQATNTGGGNAIGATAITNTENTGWVRAYENFGKPFEAIQFTDEEVINAGGLNKMSEIEFTSKLRLTTNLLYKRIATNLFGTGSSYATANNGLVGIPTAISSTGTVYGVDRGTYTQMVSAADTTTYSASAARTVTDTTNFIVDALEVGLSSCENNGALRENLVVVLNAAAYKNLKVALPYALGERSDKSIERMSKKGWEAFRVDGVVYMKDAYMTTSGRAYIIDMDSTSLMFKKGAAFSLFANTLNAGYTTHNNRLVAAVQLYMLNPRRCYQYTGLCA